MEGLIKKQVSLLEMVGVMRVYEYGMIVFWHDKVSFVARQRLQGGAVFHHGTAIPKEDWTHTGLSVRPWFRVITLIRMKGGLLS